MVHGDVGVHGYELHPLLIVGKIENTQVGHHPPDLVPVPHGGRQAGHPVVTRPGHHVDLGNEGPGGVVGHPVGGGVIDQVPWGTA